MAATLGGAALWYANRGFLVFPLREGQKTPATRNGFHDSSMSPDTIRRWWTKNPRYNIGLVTGHYFDVIDIDGPDGVQSATLLEDQGRLPEPIALAATPRGYHWCITPTGDRNAAGLMPGIDYRGHGGYIVAPPSIVNGATYRWLQPPNL
jgi:hypothetical protein